MTIYESSCRLVGVTPESAASLARRLESVARDAQRLGLIVFGGAVGGSLRANTMTGPVVVASVAGSWDGGDGGMVDDEAGIMRGEQ